eukprot:gb/GEZN01011289.1/.p1 GENE.gb/GEZN01011289.1/~~gb/GEZN01011289.1/.p1  ORF type:complete len:374 (+),score=40.32 gb/GEZN01011289.1/:149-1123(+)
MIRQRTRLERHKRRLRTYCNAWTCVYVPCVALRIKDSISSWDTMIYSQFLDCVQLSSELGVLFLGVFAMASFVYMLHNFQQDALVKQVPQQLQRKRPTTEMKDNNTQPQVEEIVLQEFQNHDEGKERRTAAQNQQPNPQVQPSDAVDDDKLNSHQSGSKHSDLIGWLAMVTHESSPKTKMHQQSGQSYIVAIYDQLQLDRVVHPQPDFTGRPLEYLVPPLAESKTPRLPFAGSMHSLREETDESEALHLPSILGTPESSHASNLTKHAMENMGDIQRVAVTLQTSDIKNDISGKKSPFSKSAFVRPIKYQPKNTKNETMPSNIT